QLIQFGAQPCMARRRDVFRTWARRRPIAAHIRRSLVRICAHTHSLSPLARLGWKHTSNRHDQVLRTFCRRSHRTPDLRGIQRRGRAGCAVAAPTRNARAACSAGPQFSSRSGGYQDPQLGHAALTLRHRPRAGEYAPAPRACDNPLKPGQKAALCEWVSRRVEMRALKIALIGAVMLLSGCGYNTLQTQDEAVTAAW